MIVRPFFFVFKQHFWWHREVGTATFLTTAYLPRWGLSAGKRPTNRTNFGHERSATLLPLQSGVANGLYVHSTTYISIGKAPLVNNSVNNKIGTHIAILG